MKASVKKLTLYFRAKVRQNEDISHMFAETSDKLKQIFPDMRAGMITEFHHPCFPSEVEKAQKDGYLLTKWENSDFFLIREQKYTISGGDPLTGLTQVQERMPDTFVVAVITQEWAEEWVAK